MSLKNLAILCILVIAATGAVVDVNNSTGNDESTIVVAVAVTGVVEITTTCEIRLVEADPPENFFSYTCGSRCCYVGFGREAYNVKILDGIKDKYGIEGTRFDPMPTKSGNYTYEMTYKRGIAYSEKKENFSIIYEFHRPTPPVVANPQIANRELVNELVFSMYLPTSSGECKDVNIPATCILPELYRNRYTLTYVDSYERGAWEYSANLTQGNLVTNDSDIKIPRLDWPDYNGLFLFNVTTADAHTGMVADDVVYAVVSISTRPVSLSVNSPSEISVIPIQSVKFNARVWWDFTTKVATTNFDSLRNMTFIQWWRVFSLKNGTFFESPIYSRNGSELTVPSSIIKEHIGETLYITNWGKRTDYILPNNTVAAHTTTVTVNPPPLEPIISQGRLLKIFKNQELYLDANHTVIPHDELGTASLRYNWTTSCDFDIMIELPGILFTSCVCSLLTNIGSLTESHVQFDTSSVVSPSDNGVCRFFVEVSDRYNRTVNTSIIVNVGVTAALPIAVRIQPTATILRNTVTLRVRGRILNESAPIVSYGQTPVEYELTRCDLLRLGYELYWQDASQGLNFDWDCSESNNSCQIFGTYQNNTDLVIHLDKMGPVHPRFLVLVLRRVSDGEMSFNGIALNLRPTPFISQLTAEVLTADTRFQYFEDTCPKVQISFYVDSEGDDDENAQFRLVFTPFGTGVSAPLQSTQFSGVFVIPLTLNGTVEVIATTGMGGQFSLSIDFNYDFVDCRTSQLLELDFMSDVLKLVDGSTSLSDLSSGLMTEFLGLFDSQNITSDIANDMTMLVDSLVTTIQTETENYLAQKEDVESFMSQISYLSLIHRAVNTSDVNLTVISAFENSSSNALAVGLALDPSLYYSYPDSSFVGISEFVQNSFGIINISNAFVNSAEEMFRNYSDILSYEAVCGERGQQFGQSTLLYSFENVEVCNLNDTSFGSTPNSPNLTASFDIPTNTPAFVEHKCLHAYIRTLVDTPLHSVKPLPVPSKPDRSGSSGSKSKGFLEQSGSEVDNETEMVVPNSTVYTIYFEDFPDYTYAEAVFRDWEPNGALRKKDVEVNELTDPVSVRIPVDAETLLQYNIDNVTISCGFWNETIGWDLTGCVTLNNDTVAQDGYLLCECSHLSDYSWLLPHVNTPDSWVPKAPDPQKWFVYTGTGIILVLLTFMWLISWVMDIVTYIRLYFRLEKIRDYDASKAMHSRMLPVFYLLKAKNRLLFEHDWIGIFFQNPFNHFTRARKATVLLVFLIQSFLVSAVFFLFADTKEESTFPIYLVLVNGIISSLVSIPVPLLLGLFFKNTKSFYVNLLLKLLMKYKITHLDFTEEELNELGVTRKEIELDLADVYDDDSDRSASGSVSGSGSVSSRESDIESGSVSESESESVSSSESESVSSSESDSESESSDESVEETDEEQPETTAQATIANVTAVEADEESGALGDNTFGTTSDGVAKETLNKKKQKFYLGTFASLDGNEEIKQQNWFLKFRKKRHAKADAKRRRLHSPKIPAVFVLIPYLFSFFYIIFCLYFLWLYCDSFNKYQCWDWTFSFTVSSFQDMLLNQPIKLWITSLVFVLLGIC